MDDKKRLSKDAFNLQATTYDTDNNGKHSRTLYPHIIDRLSDILFDNVLDVGCGTGEILNTIKNRYPAVSLYGIDISEEMLKKAKEKLLNTAELSLGDAECLPYENDYFEKGTGNQKNGSSRNIHPDIKYTCIWMCLFYSRQYIPVFLYKVSGRD